MDLKCQGKSTTQKLRPIGNKWIYLLDKIDDASTHDSNLYSVERAALYVLIMWASIVTER